ncbi:hypothetical protein KBD45_06455 [Candidatus Dojkabacteria bacterium]|nr:hypothetical protein [Candidatus Dojkabacteria bacterium]
MTTLNIEMNSTISAVTQVQPIDQDSSSPFDNPYVAYLVSPAIVIGIVIWVVYKLLNLGEIKEKFFKALEEIKELKSDVKKLVTDVTIIRTHEIESGGITAQAFAPGSPLKLLPRGLIILEASGFKKIYQDNKEWFIDEVKKYNVKTLSDVDDACYQLVQQCGTDSKFANYKEISFQNGITIDILLKILSIYLRDEVAKQIPLEEDI